MYCTNVQFNVLYNVQYNVLYNVLYIVLYCTVLSTLGHHHSASLQVSCVRCLVTGAMCYVPGVNTKGAGLICGPGARYYVPGIICQGLCAGY